ncbi:hypothetical protein QP028_13385 [Corynebacterium suedekumii]|nr:hypothetical protein QP028_13385 [Corynebacterium suedekumii]
MTEGQWDLIRRIAAVLAAVALRRRPRARLPRRRDVRAGRTERGHARHRGGGVLRGLPGPRGGVPRRGHRPGLRPDHLRRATDPGRGRRGAGAP